ncbi:MotA/TolQ/ExbB proton channel family protein [Neopusillimonas maritima]|uniref:Flagellar motor protein MotA n=1 Tax=Neopusillimonas maritima TaxID=2026239 RepID=A0A3A1YSA8_9BURK|nr:MotA/TolQ/ExbB proton channel family protein [Neopusillimonas maritima]MAL01133.1 flagellar motor protein MotA [Alcaligenaceae bacterium]MBF24368.1 flagellar motor protein MotA [Pusillimonas sp.]MBF24873.1 flagellar motor protein MotA [Pusillimonas sp.]RII83765.1 flagellar motor protein MotA [Neopusillimonas maritima]RIY39810.1 flagellar motor protein MotA [Neopusillimonas maritima]
MLQIIHDAGWPIWLLIVTSVLGLALIIERFLSLRTKLIVPEHLLDRVTELMRQKSPSSNALEKLASSSPLGRVLAEVIAVRRHDTIYRQAAIEDVGKDVAYRLNRYVPSLATVAVVSPLLGLFGTVVGMIEIFASYTPAGGDPAQLARGISVALYNTGFGIIIAVPALIFHRFFRARVDHFLHQIEHQASTLDRILQQDLRSTPSSPN